MSPQKLAQSWDQIVIGAGSSAINFLYSAFKGTEKNFLQKRTLVIGKTDLWTPMDPNHNMGQPGKLLRGVEEWKKVGENKDGGGIYQKQQYLSSGGYVKSLQNLKDTVQVQRDNAGMKLQFLSDTVSTVKPSASRYEVNTVQNGRLYAQQVIVASGAGPGNKLNAPGPRSIKIIGERSLRTQPRAYPEIIDATDYLYWEPDNVQPGMKVLIQGGSATASWAAAGAFQNKSDFLWLNARGLQQIQTEGNPVARNTSTIKRAADEMRIFRGSIVEIEVLNVKDPEPRLKVRFKAQLDSELDSPHQDGDPAPVGVSDTFHQVVHALGANPLGEFGPGAILDTSIRNNLQVLWDKGNLEPNKDTAIAMYHENDVFSSLWIVGASLFRGAGTNENLTKEIQKSYTSLNEMLTHASRPPEGIANLKIRIQALTKQAETDPAKFDWNLASPLQVRNLLEAVYGKQLSAGQREQLAKEIIELRAKQQFLLPKSEIKKKVDTFKTQNKLNIDTTKLQLEGKINLRVETSDTRKV